MRKDPLWRMRMATVLLSFIEFLLFFNWITKVKVMDEQKELNIGEMAVLLVDNLIVLVDV